ncbi:MAG: hypothetical protein EPO24_08400 [Bacteroidetes bacterium]|nr:MAG: hypothetical protein EPO24_08400 [Bacteroidota bacterium]
MKNRKTIKSKIVKTELVEWRKLKWFQSNLKEISRSNFEKLKKSLINNSFIMPFHVWQQGKTRWILDGHHRQQAIQELEKEGYKIEDRLPANFMDCKDRKEAAKLVLIYSSIYAETTDNGLYDFLNLENLDLESLNLEIVLPDIENGNISHSLANIIEEGLRPYRRTHVLLSFNPDKIIEIAQYLEQIKLIKGIEIEQCSN